MAANVERLFTNGLHAGVHPFLDQLLDARVSAHFFIERDGRCTQFVSCSERAWHAGASSFRGRLRCNDFSIGVEVEGTDFEPYADAQYVTLNALLAALIDAYPIEAVVRHSAIASERKTDRSALTGTGLNRCCAPRGLSDAFSVQRPTLVLCRRIDAPRIDRG
jgi:AmpD protein